MYLLNNRRKWIVRRRPEGATVPMSECDIQVETSVQYTGTARFPSVSVSFGGEPLVLDVDYALTYRDNVEVGNGTVSVTGLGNFVGSGNFSSPRSFDQRCRSPSSGPPPRTCFQRKPVGSSQR